jgi:predicted transcriptional regulator
VYSCCKTYLGHNIKVFILETYIGIIGGQAMETKAQDNKMRLVPTMHAILCELKTKDFYKYGVPLKEIVEGTRLAKNTVSMYMTTLLQLGLVSRPLRGHYKITEKGVQVLQIYGKTDVEINIRGGEKE